MAKRRLPTRDECLSGIPLMLGNARAHLEGADILAGDGKYGFAVAHLVYALEESEKGRTLAKVVLGDVQSDEEIYRALYHHAERHVGALMKSWSSGAAVIDLMAEGLRERIGLRPERTEKERYEEVIRRHPEVLPEDWPETAGATREQSLYVDLREAGWVSPLRSDSSAYERLRPAVAMLLDYFSAAYQREILPIVSSASRQISLPNLSQRPLRSEPYHQNTTRDFTTNNHSLALIGTKFPATEYKTAPGDTDDTLRTP